MKYLPIKIKRRGFIYLLVFRNRAGVIYAQYTEDGTLIAYEAFKPKKTPACTRITANNRRVVYPESERFPSDEHFGKIAWSFPCFGDDPVKAYELARKKIG